MCYNLIHAILTSLYIYILFFSFFFFSETELILILCFMASLRPKFMWLHPLEYKLKCNHIDNSSFLESVLMVQGELCQMVLSMYLM